MSAIFVRPLPFVASPASPAPTLGNIGNLAIDPPGLIWRGSTSSYLIVDLGAGTLAYDTVALVGSNLRASDTVTVRLGVLNDGLNGYQAGPVPAFVGMKDDLTTTKTIIFLGSTRTERYMRIDISAPGHPDGYVQFQRLVAGKAITTGGIDYECELGFDDQSVIESFPGGSTVDEYGVPTTWKFSTGWISEASWYGEWFPFLRNVGNRRAILFIPQDETPAVWQSAAIFGRIVNRPSGKSEHYNGWRFEATIASNAL